MVTWRMSATYGSTTQMEDDACVYELPSRCGQTFVDAMLVRLLRCVSRCLPDL